MTTVKPTPPRDPTVLGLLVSNWLDGLEEIGFDPAPLIDGIADRAALRRPSARMRWSSAAEALDRAMALYGRDVVEKAGEVHVARGTMFGALASLFVRPATFYAACISTGRVVWPIEIVRAELRGRDFFHEGRIPAGQRPAEGFFVTTIGTLRSALRVVGLPDADVEATVTPTRGVYHVRLPAEALVRRPLRQPRMSAILTILEQFEPYGRRLANRLIHEVLMKSAPPEPSRTLVLDLQRDLGLTRSEARVAARVAAGMSVAEIARDLRVREATVHVHLRSTFRKVGVRRQAELVTLLRV